MATETPTPLALLLADEVYQDRTTGKWIIAGVFSQILGTALPVIREQIVVFWQVTGVKDPVDLRLRIEHSGSGEPIFEVRGPISGKSPLDVISLSVKARALPFNKVGKYWIQLMSDEEILIQAPLQVTLREQEPPPVRTGEAPQ